jgi:oligopeptide/dipeptide ABC transporter ATP-binding protein
MVEKMSESSILAGRDIVKYFPVKAGLFGRSHKSVKAVDGVNMDVRESENLAIVGESGCGKTTLGRILCGILEPTRGVVEYQGKPVDTMKPRDFASNVQPIFQDPYSALNPRKTIRKILAKPFMVHGIRYDEQVLCHLLDQVGLSPPKPFLDRYPHELSGGQRQRVVMARALTLNPRVIIADEPVSGLDATVQAQILNLIRTLQSTYATTYVIITHDITLVKSMCQRIAVMYLGKIVEVGPTREIVANPIHPYTVSLLRSFPSGDPDTRDWIDSPPITGEVPSATEPPSGCRFRTRCPMVIEECAMKEPRLEPCGKNHHVACPVVLRTGRIALASS